MTHIDDLLKFYAFVDHWNKQQQEEYPLEQRTITCILESDKEHSLVLRDTTED